MFVCVLNYDEFLVDIFSEALIYFMPEQCMPPEIDLCAWL